MELTFSKRYGYESIDMPFQTNDMDSTLRIELWNVYFIHIHNFNKKKTNNYIANYIPGTPYYLYNDNYEIFLKNAWLDFFKKAIDDYPLKITLVQDFIRNFIENDVWYKIYNFFEYILKNTENNNIVDHKNLVNIINSKLKDNYAGYSIINNEFIAITNEIEINEIKNTIKLANENNFYGLKEHLKSALRFISLKPSPDFRNAIKESISMVEAVAKKIAPKTSELGDALKKLEQNQTLNPRFKNGIEKLYAYTNDKNGIRHALMEEQNIVDYEEAKFFLVICSAFSNYLIEKGKKNNLLL